MNIKSQDYNDVTVVSLKGEFDTDSASAFAAAISEIIGKGFTGIVLDLSDVDFVDSVGLEKLLWAKQYCIENSCQMKIAAASVNCAKILEITRLEAEFDRYDELAEAVKSFV